MTGPDLAPRPIGLELEVRQWHRLHDSQVFGRLQGTAVDADVEAQGDEFLHFGEGAGEGVDEAAEGEGGEMWGEDAEEGFVGGAGVEEEGELELWGV